VTVGLLFDNKTEKNIEKRVKYLKPDLLLPHYSIFNKYEKLYEESGLKTIVWTVNDEKDVRKFLKDERVLGIISDYPDKAVTYSS
jgi:glycerophosphoryl diester phosphodiesterase